MEITNTYNTGKVKKTPFERMMDISLNDPALQDFIVYNELKRNYQFLKDLDTIKKNDVFTEEATSALKWYFIRIHDLQLSEILIKQFLHLMGQQKVINPVKDWLKTLKWDGLHRLDSWLHLYSGCELNTYTSKVGVMMLCGAIQRIMEPGCKFDYMIILEGEQGIKKSMLFEVLGGAFYDALTFTQNEIRLIENMQGSWIIEIADLSGFKKQEIEWLRGFITRRKDKCRLAYRRDPLDLGRHNIFVGTHNPSGDNEYLKDDTGNRRFLPISCGKLNINGLKDVREQLFAEAFTRYRTEELFLTGDAEDIAKQEQANREETDVWTNMVKTYISTRQITNTADVLKECIHIDLSKASLYDKIRVGKIIKKLKWLRKQNRYGEWEYHSPNYISDTDTQPDTNTPASIPQIAQMSNHQQGLHIKEGEINWEE